MLKNITIFFITAFVLGVGIVFSYDNINTHPQLSRAAENVFNNSANPNKINAEQMKWIEKGAINEDTDPRYLNHFYNPKTGQGLKDGWWSGMPAKQWAQKQTSATGDYGYQTILDNYKQGNKDRAWQGVGHILHLVQDMSVPAHVRNDGHSEGDIYENWAQHFGKVDAVNVNKISIRSLDQVFDNLANFTSDNFFSKDTIKIVNIAEYKIIENNDGGKKIKYLSKNINGKNIRLTLVDDNSFVPIYSIEKNQLLNNDYWSILSPKAIGYSAGVIELFANEFKKIDDQKAAEQAKMNWLQKLSTNLNEAVISKVDLSNVAYIWGDAFMAARPVVAGEFNAMLAAANLTGKTIGAGNELIVDTSKTVVEKVAVAAGEVKGVFIAATEEKKPVKIIDNKTFAPKVVSVDEVKIARVIDGDTIELVTGEKIRYIGVDTPELNGVGSADDECLAWAAKVRNEQLIQSGQTRLVSDAGADKDNYGRLLRYVYAGNTFVNGQLANEGLAKEFFCQAGWNNCPVMSDATRKKIILDAANTAMANKRGLYSGVCDKKMEVIKEVTLAPIAEKIVQPEVQEIAKNVQIIFNNGLANNVAETENVVIVLDDGINNNEDDEEQQTDEIATSTDDDMATTTDDIATTTDAVATSTPEIATSTDPEISINDVDFEIFDVNTGIDDFTSSTTIGINIECIANQIEYFLTEDEGGPTEDSIWLADSPEDFVVASDDYRVVNIYLWIRQNGIVLSDYIDADIVLDTKAPDIEFNNMPPQVTDSNSASFDISCSDSLQDFFDNVGWENAITWNYKLDDGEWTLGRNNDDINFYDLINGEHVLYIEAVDAALNVATSSYAWTIDPDLNTVDNQADHVVISEILFGTAYSADEEFIELYNPTEQNIDLSDYRLTRKNSNGTESILISAFGNTATSIIYKRSFLLIAPTGLIRYEGIPLQDSHSSYTNTSNRITDDDTIILYSDNDNTIVDKVGYNNAVDFENQPFIDFTEGKSIERKYRRNSTYETMFIGEDRYYGNGYDSGNNASDFIIRDVVEPQYWDWEDGVDHQPVLW